jgi:hypothetical protein
MFFLTIQHAAKWSRPILKMVLQGFLVVTLFFGVFVHTLQGVYNTETIQWNDYPQADLVPDFYVWNWRYPAFFVTPEMNGMKRLESNMWSRCKDISSQLQDGAAVYCFEPDPRSRKILEKLNAGNREFNQVRFFNNLYDLRLGKCDTFWTTSSIRELLWNNADVEEVKDNANETTLGHWLMLHENYTILLTFNPDSLDFTSKETYRFLSSKGMLLDSAGLEIPTVAYLRNGVLQEMQLNETEGASLNVKVGDEVVWISSGSSLFQKPSSIVYKGMEHAYLRNGWNVLVLDDNGQIVQRSAFETTIADRQFKELRRWHFIEP